jgi:hypothetical protein
MEDLHIEDGSNDRMYFTMVPNYILNHSTAIDQALYLQMKRFAGEKNGGGYCTASKRTLLKKMGVGPKALNTSLKYLVEHKWIENVGSRKVMTDGGAQDVQIYRVNDIWKLNAEYYQGANESTPLPKQGADERSKGANESAPSKNYNKNKELGDANAPQRERSKELEPEERPKKETRSKDKLAVYFLFSSKEQPWWRHAQQKKAALSLFDLVGIEKVRRGLALMKENEDDKYCPQAATPFEYESKLEALKRYAKNHA